MAPTFAFSFDYLNKTQIKRVMEGLNMSRYEKLYNVFVEYSAIQTAKKLLKNGVAIEIIADSTELEIGTIEELKEQLELESDENDSSDE